MLHVLCVLLYNSTIRRPRMHGGRDRGVRVRGGPSDQAPVVEALDAVAAADRGGPSGRGRVRGSRAKVRHERPGPSTIEELALLLN